VIAALQKGVAHGMKPFECAAPGNLKDATDLLAAKWGEQILAGGTDLVTCLKQNLTAPNRREPEKRR
jgi:CO/xanthine dehydrogenase FAD-binding subunit